VHTCHHCWQWRIEKIGNFLLKLCCQVAWHSCVYVQTFIEIGRLLEVYLLIVPIDASHRHKVNTLVRSLTCWSLLVLYSWCWKPTYSTWYMDGLVMLHIFVVVGFWINSSRLADSIDYLEEKIKFIYFLWYVYGCKCKFQLLIRFKQRGLLLFVLHQIVTPHFTNKIHFEQSLLYHLMF
jgi:hypothetical protein